MNKYQKIVQKAFAVCALAALSLSCVGKDEPKSTLIPEPSPTPTPAVQKSESDVAKLVVRFQIGHLHGEKSFHYLPSEAVLENKNLQDEQMLAFKLVDGKWMRVDTLMVQNGDKTETIHGLDKLLAYRWHDTRKANPFTGEISGSDYPQYGLLLEAYDAQGKLLNLGEIAKKDAYQFFLYPSDIKDYDTNQTIKANADYKNIMTYTCLDTEVYNKSAHRGTTKFRSEQDPINYKGYVIFPILGSSFNFNIDLYHTTKGKLEGGKASEYYQPNATVKQGELLAHLSIPLIVFAPFSMKQYASTTDIKNALVNINDFSRNRPEEEDPEGTELKFAQDAARRLEKILGKTWDKIGEDFTYNRLAPRASEATGGSFY